MPGADPKDVVVNMRTAVFTRQGPEMIPREMTLPLLNIPVGPSYPLARVLYRKQPALVFVAWTEGETRPDVCVHKNGPCLVGYDGRVDSGITVDYAKAGFPTVKMVVDVRPGTRVYVARDSYRGWNCNHYMTCLEIPGPGKAVSVVTPDGDIGVVRLTTAWNEPARRAKVKGTTLRLEGWISVPGEKGHIPSDEVECRLGMVGAELKRTKSSIASTVPRTRTLLVW